MDFTRNPSALKSDFSNIGSEAYAYLKNSNSLFGTPIERLSRMNAPAVQLYKEHNIDIAAEPLEIAVCAQHNNGGLAVNHWWETGISHLFAVGEVAGTHGIYRPGGSALNAGQAGAARAALYIARKYKNAPRGAAEFTETARALTTEKIELAERFMNNGGGISPYDARKEMRARMSGDAAHIRNTENILNAVSETRKQLIEARGSTRVDAPRDLICAFENIDLLITQLLYLEAMADYAENGGGSRGSYLVYNKNGRLPAPNLPEIFRFTLDDGRLNSKIQTAFYGKDGICSFNYEDVRPIPKDDYWFENVWNDFRNGRIYEI
jgi:succinate dehydrogenase/fumarate reductase flavoprotein subunit